MYSPLIVLNIQFEDGNPSQLQNNRKKIFIFSFNYNNFQFSHKSGSSKSLFLLSLTVTKLKSTTKGTKTIFRNNLNPLSVNPTKWSNPLKQIVGNLPTNCLSVFDHFLGQFPSQSVKLYAVNLFEGKVGNTIIKLFSCSNFRLVQYKTVNVLKFQEQRKKNEGYLTPLKFTLNRILVCVLVFSVFNNLLVSI